MNKPSKLGATLMVTGCCIGAGMIGMPVMSALTGFVPSIVAMFLCYLFTTTTGLLLVEATLWFDGQVNLPSIVEHTLGKIGKIITIGLFLFLFYCVFIAYLDAGGSMFAEIVSAILNRQVPHYVGVLSCMSFVFAIVYAGAKLVDGLNRYMLIAMVISFVVLIAVGLPNVSTTNLLHNDWKLMYGVVPILLISFGYQNLVPSITYYLQRNVNAIRFAIIVGNLIPFFVYFIWEYVILGMLPGGVITNSNEVELVAQLLEKAAISSLSVMFFIKSFSMFAMLTSFLPSAVSFVDFLKDGFSKFTHQQSELIFHLLVFVPPALCTLIYPKIFLHALGFAGGFIDVLLFGVLPATVVLVGRKQFTLSSRVAFGAGSGASFEDEAKSTYQVTGGYMTPVLILILSISMLMFKLLGL